MRHTGTLAEAGPGKGSDLPTQCQRHAAYTGLVMRWYQSAVIIHVTIAEDGGTRFLIDYFISGKEPSCSKV
jgi:hypothetical protein